LIVMPLATASSRASVTSRPALLVPSPETSMVRRVDSKGAEGARRLQQAVAETFRRGGVADRRPVDHHPLRADARPFDEADRDAAGAAGADGVEHARIGDRRRVALALQLELGPVDAARHVGRERQQQIDRLGCGRDERTEYHRKQNRSQYRLYRLHRPPRCRVRRPHSTAARLAQD
jgi:hypothetical protein